MTPSPDLCKVLEQLGYTTLLDTPRGTIVMCWECHSRTLSGETWRHTTQCQVGRVHSIVVNISTGTYALH